jgi:hypothetical protein
MKAIFNLLLLLAFFVSADSAWAAVAFGNSISPASTTANSLTSGNFTIAGSNLAIIVGITFYTAGTSVSSVSWSLGSGTAVKIADTAIATGGTSQIWAIPAPTAGTGTISVALTSSIGLAWRFCAAYFTGADQTTPATDPVINTVSQANFTLTPANLTANDASFGEGNNNNGNMTSAGANQLLVDNSTTTVSTATSYSTGTASITFVAADSGGGKAMSACRIAAAASSAAPVRVIGGGIL